MARVTFIFDKEKDMKNIWDKCNKKPPFGKFRIPPELEKICVGKRFDKAKPGLRKFLRKLYNSNYIKSFQKTMQELWDEIENEFFKKMDSLMKKEYNKEIKAYITTIEICPYNTQEPSFMVSLLSSLPRAILTCGHEIMHLYFHEFYWKDIEKKIGSKKTGDLKEALTTLLNPEFRELFFSQDFGYQEHRELRNFILTSWNEEKDFEKLLDKCVDYFQTQTTDS